MTYTEQSGVQCTIETITPEVASKLLELNTNNRPLNQRHVEFLVDEIKQGRWRMNGESIKLNGVQLLDGQHRLTAVAMSGKAIQCLVVRGINTDAFSTIDLTRRRTGGDVLSIAGEIHATNLAAALQVIYCYRTRQFMRSFRLPATQIQNELSLFPGCRSSVSKVQQRSVLMPTSVLSGFHYLGSLVCKETADRFLEDLISGAGLTTGDPVLLLRNRLIENKKSKARLVKTYIAALTIKAFNARLTGVPIKQLRWTTDGRNTEEFPEIEGLPPQVVVERAQALNITENAL